MTDLVEWLLAQFQGDGIDQGHCPDWYANLKDAQVVAEVNKSTVFEVYDRVKDGRLSGEDFERALIASRAEKLFLDEVARIRKFREGR